MNEQLLIPFNVDYDYINEQKKTSVLSRHDGREKILEVGKTSLSQVTDYLQFRFPPVIALLRCLTGACPRCLHE